MMLCRRCVLPLVSKGWRDTCNQQSSIVWRDVELVTTRRGERDDNCKVVDLCMSLKSDTPLVWLAKRASGMTQFRLAGDFSSLTQRKVRTSARASQPPQPLEHTLFVCLPQQTASHALLLAHQLLS